MTTENSVGGLFAAWWRNLSGSFADGARAATALPALTLLMVGIELGQQLLEPALCLWFVSAALGDDRFGPVSSAFATLWLYVWALPLIFLARIPFNAAHQLLNTHAAGKSGRLLWAMLALDAVVVVALVTVMAAAQVRVAAFIAERRDLTASVRL